MNTETQEDLKKLEGMADVILEKAGHLTGPEFVKAAFALTYPVDTLVAWSMVRGFTYNTVRAVTNGNRSGGEKANAIRGALARDIGIPVEELFRVPGQSMAA